MISDLCCGNISLSWKGEDKSPLEAPNYPPYEAGQWILESNYLANKPGVHGLPLDPLDTWAILKTG